MKMLLVLLLQLFLLLIRKDCIFSKPLNKQHEEPAIIMKLNGKKHAANNRIWLPEYDRNIKKFTNASIDEQDAILFEYIFNNTFTSIQRSIRFTSNAIKLSTNTLAGIISVIIKSTGGICNLMANLFWILSSKFEKMSGMNNEFSIKSSKTMNNTAKVLYTLGNTFIWSGDILESVTVGLSDALVDSFTGLEFMSTSSNDIIKVLLQSNHKTANNFTSSMAPHQNYGQISKDEIMIDTCNINQNNRKDTANYPDSTIAETYKYDDRYTHIGANSLSVYSSAASDSFQELLMRQLNISNTDLNGSNLRKISEQINGTNINSTSTTEKAQERDSNDTYFTSLLISSYHSYLHLLNISLNYQHLVSTLYDGIVYILGQFIRMSILLWDHQVSFVYSEHSDSATGSEQIPSQGFFYIMSLIFTFLIAVFPMSSIRMKIAVFLLLANILYVCFLSIENVQRARIKLHAQIQAKHDLLSHQSKQLSYSESYSQLPHHEQFLSVQQQQQSESSVWLNVILNEIWEVLSKNNKVSTGGLGPYVSLLYSDMLKTELGKVPPGVANIRLKRFELGSSPPLLNGVHVKTEHNLTCRQMLGLQQQHKNLTAKQLKKYQSTMSQQQYYPYDFFHHLYNETSNQSLFRNKTHNSSSIDSDDDGIHPSALSSFLSHFTYFQLYNKEKLGYLANWIQQHIVDPTTSTSQIVNDTQTNGGGIDSSQNSKSTESNGGLKEKLISHLIQNSYNQQFSAECDRLIIDLDLVFASKDMQVVLSLRSNDLQSLLPEVTVSLSELNINGHLILNASLTGDYPFLGVTQMQFKETPQLGFSLSSFGGIELSTVPYAFYWVNASIYWIINQYTAPFSTSLDLRHLICPSCDDEEKLSKSVIDAFLKSWKHGSSELWNITINHVSNQTSKVKHVLHNIHKELQRKIPFRKLSKYVQLKVSQSEYIKSAINLLSRTTMISPSSGGSIPWVMDIYKDSLQNMNSQQYKDDTIKASYPKENNDRKKDEHQHHMHNLSNHELHHHLKQAKIHLSSVMQLYYQYSYNSLTYWINGFTWRLGLV